MTDNNSVMIPVAQRRNGGVSAERLPELGGTALDKRPLIELLDILEAQETTYHELLSVTEAKRDAMVAVDVGGLEAVLEREEGVVARLNELENHRMDSVDLLKARWGIALEDQLDKMR